jgi:hypothetical protein
MVECPFEIYCYKLRINSLGYFGFFWKYSVAIFGSNMVLSGKNFLGEKREKSK